MNTLSQFELPAERKEDMRKAKRLEWWTIAYMVSVILLMSVVMGSSQAMRTAWIEDLLSLIPPIGFLIAAQVRLKSADAKYPYGYHRAINIAYFMSAMALFSMGLFLLIDGGMKLIQAEHPTIGTVTLWGDTFWLGWLMLPVLVWATVPSLLLGKAKIQVAKRLHDKPLYGDAEMNKADWMTGAAASAGVLGIACGWWWADAAAALVISADILWDGITNLTTVIGDLMDRAPKAVDQKKMLDLPDKIRKLAMSLPWVDEVDVKMRETGHLLNGDVLIVPRDEGDLIQRRLTLMNAIKQLDWRVHEVTIQFVESEDYAESKTPLES